MAIGLNKGAGNKRPAPKAKTKPKTKPEEEEDTSAEESEIDDIDDFKMTHSTGIDKKLIILGAIAAVVVVSILIAFVTSKSSEPSGNTETQADSGDVQQQASQSTQQSPLDSADTVEGDDLIVPGESDESAYVADNGGTSADNTIKPGITNYDQEMATMTTGATVYNANDFISDLNGLEVSAIYNVESIEYVTDYVNYDTRRASIDQGMEFYWVEAKYHDRKYRIQIPYYYYKNMQDTGICKVNMEVLNLVGGGQLISYMQVIPEEE